MANVTRGCALSLGVIEMPACPYCNEPVDLRAIKHQGMFSAHRICPTCNQPFEVDPKTKQRQAVFIVLALLSLVLTILMYADVRKWVAYAISSYLALAVLIYYANGKVYLVKSERPGQSPKEDD